MKNKLVLVFSLILMTSFSPETDFYLKLRCQFIKDFNGPNDKNPKKIIFFFARNFDDGNSQELKEFLDDSVAYSRFRIDSTFKFECDIPFNHKICKSQSRFDSLASLYDLMENYEFFLSSGIQDSSKFPPKKDLDFIPVEIGIPVFYKNFAVISKVVGSSKNRFLYEFKNNRWKFSKILVHLDR